MPLSFSFVMLLIHQVTHINFFVLAIIFLIYLLFMYIPMTYFVYAKIESLVGRIILLCELIAQGIFAGSQLILEFTKPAQIGHVIQTIDNTQVADVISVLISVAFLMYLWGFKLPNFTFSKKASWIVISFLIVFSVWYVIWNGFGDGGKVSDVLFKYDLTMDKINLKMVLTSLETVMEEWLFRFAILSLLLRALQKHAHQIEWAVIINGVLFGLWHFSNGFSGQAWSATFEQMLSAGAAGMLFAAIYLYTQNLAFPIIFHFLNDFLGLSSSADMTMSAPASLDWITTLGQVIIFILIVVFLITGKRRKAIQETLDYQYTMA
ncbi:CPBP family intramembrane metalloprotease [Pediococcus ethanolidurans]|nr:CPBP family intramembrane metalloprotease [Pediococcus ethanolidurans]